MVEIYFCFGDDHKNKNKNKGAIYLYIFCFVFVSEKGVKQKQIGEGDTLH